MPRWRLRKYSQNSIAYGMRVHAWNNILPGQSENKGKGNQIWKRIGAWTCRAILENSALNDDNQDLVDTYDTNNMDAENVCSFDEEKMYPFLR